MRTDTRSLTKAHAIGVSLRHSRDWHLLISIELEVEVYCTKLLVGTYWYITPLDDNLPKLDALIFNQLSERQGQAEPEAEYLSRASAGSAQNQKATSVPVLVPVL